MKIHGNMLVSTVKKDFKKEFGLTMRIYKGMGNNFADESKTISDIRADGNSGGKINIHRSTHVSNLENQIEKEFGIRMKVAYSDNSDLIRDRNISLSDAQKKDDERTGRRLNKSTKKADKPWWKFW